MDRIRVFVISNNTLFRQGLRQAISQSEDIEVVSESGLSDEALEIVMSFSPEIVLVDIGLPLLTGLHLGRQITQRSPAISTIVLAPYKMYPAAINSRPRRRQSSTRPRVTQSRQR